jgi:hypothetical protein
MLLNNDTPSIFGDHGERIYALELDHAAYCMEVQGQRAPAWMRDANIPRLIYLRQSRHDLATEVIERLLPPGAASRIYRLTTGKMRPADDPPPGFSLHAVIFFAAHGALKEARRAAAA